MAKVATLLEGVNVDPRAGGGGGRTPSVDLTLSNPFDRIGAEAIWPIYLRSHRVVAFDSGHEMTRCYDVLRNQLINENRDKPVHQIAVTAPTKDCGVTVTAANLALSFARVHETNVLLVDMNSKSPSMGRTLGLSAMTQDEERNGSLLSVDVAGTHMYVLRLGLHDATALARTDAARLLSQVAQARARVMPSVIIYDMPPVMVADELNAVAKEADSAVVVLAVGHSTVAEYEICKTYLGDRKGIRVVLNKSRKHGL
jgi:protein-tyrosine kinase